MAITGYDYGSQENPRMGTLEPNRNGWYEMAMKAEVSGGYLGGQRGTHRILGHGLWTLLDP